eukprot:s629_g25.t2
MTPVAHGSKREAVAYPCATAANEEGCLIPCSFKSKVTLETCSRFVWFECPSDSFVGGWRTVFLLHPDGFDLPAEALCRKKVDKSCEDQLQEEACAARCPSVFCEVFAATPFNLALDSKCDLHVLLSERQQEAARLGARSFEFKAEGELRRVCSLWKDGATLPLKVLDGNCCTVARGPVTFLTGSRMSTFWTLMRDLPTLKECVKAWPLSRIVSELAGGSVHQAVQGYANLPNPPEGGGRPGPRGLVRRHAKGVFSFSGRNTMTDMNRPQELAVHVDLNLRARVYLRLNFLMVRLHG